MCFYVLHICFYTQNYFLGEKGVPQNTLSKKLSGAMAIRHHQGPLRRVDHVIVTHNL